MKKEDIEQKEARDKQYYTTFFILFFPSILIAITASIENAWTRIGIQVLLVLYQYFIVNSFLDRYYHYD